MIDSIGSKLKDYAPLVVRIGLSVIAFLVGARLINHVGSRQVGELAVAAIYILGGLLVLVGLLTRWAALALFIVILIHIIDGPKLDAITDANDRVWFAALCMSLAVYFTGGGEMSVDLKQKRKQDK